jgi:hypothetical protein
MNNNEQISNGMDALNVVVNHNEGEELKRLNAENARLRETLQAVKDAAEEKADYYFDLVWYARNPDPLKWVPNFFKDKREKLGEEKFEEFMKDIHSLAGAEGSWNHGFNSGCLAMARLLKELSSITKPRVWDDDGSDVDDSYVESVEEQRQGALAEFPFLDT